MCKQNPPTRTTFLRSMFETYPRTIENNQNTKSDAHNYYILFIVWGLTSLSIIFHSYGHVALSEAFSGKRSRTKS